MRTLSFCLALGALSLGAATAAHALPPPSAYVTVVYDPQTPIARNGALLVENTGPGSGAAAPNVIVRVDDASPTIAGTVKQVSGQYWSWLPDEPLAPGLYLVSTNAFAGAPWTDQEVVFSDELAPEKPNIAVTAVPMVEEYLDNFNCCRYDGKAVGEGQCFPDVLLRTLYVGYELTSTESAVGLHQFLFKTSIPGDSVSYQGHPAEQSNAINVLPFYEQAPEYCGVIEAIDLATQTVHTYPELSPLCVPHGDLGVIGYASVDYDAAKLDRNNCDAPPPALVEAWCEVNRDACEPLETDELIENGCRYYDGYCNGGVVPEPGVADAGALDDGTSDPPVIAMPDAGTAPPDASGGGGASGESGEGGAGPGLEPPVVEGQPTPAVSTPSSSSGCSAATPGRASSHLALLMLVLLALRFAHSRNTRARLPPIAKP